DAVLAAGLDPVRGAPGDEPVQHGLDLVGRRVAGGAQAVAGEGVPELAEGLLGRACGWLSLDDLGAEAFAAEAGVLVGLGAAEPMVDVQGGHAVAELAEGVPEAGRVGAAGDEREHLGAG